MIIKFNLLPKKEVVKPEEIKEKYIFLKTFLVIFIIVIVTIVVEGIYLGYNLKSLKSEKMKKETKLKEYKKIAQKVKILEKKSEEIKKRISTIIDLKKRQGKELQKIETLIRNIGRNRIVFTQVSIEPSQAEITGVSSDLKDIANYLKNLENQQGIIKEVSLSETVKKEAYIEFKAGVLF
ncbi:hypothetical protein DRN73_10255 [Candidatus Pacearchaeota archaeon]|nr:MAG: hypothetical protein DRN73_10255 [Candidatus Pacearchaeota archaeon]